MPPPHTPSRVLAPLILLTVIALVALIVVTGAGSGASQGPTLKDAPPIQAAVRTPTRRTYTVRRGDDLSSIAVRFDVPLESLTDLNPRVDPESVSIGTRLKLR